MQKAKWLSEEALQTAENRREVKGKGENDRYTYLNAEFQRIYPKIYSLDYPRRDKKVFFSDHLKK